jgi:hypothetical protein
MRSGIPKEGQATNFKKDYIRLNSRGYDTSEKRKKANFYNDAPPPPLNAMPNQKLGQIPLR